MTRGTYAEYAVVPAWQLVKLPDHVDFTTVAAAMLQGMTGNYLDALYVLLLKNRRRTCW